MTATAPLKLSVALVTRNRPESLERFLRSMRRQTVAPFEIVISDDSDPELSGRVRDLATEHGCKYVPGPRRGLYANRNNAGRACAGSHILSADDDHTHPRDFMEKLYRLLALDPRRVWVISERNPDMPDRPHVCPAEMTRSGLVRTPVDDQDCAAIAEGSTVYPREVFTTTDGYDQTYAFGGIRYLWGKHLKRNGWRLSYFGGTYVWHHLDQAQARAKDTEWLRNQICCNCYVLLANGVILEKSLLGVARGLFHLVKALALGDSIEGYDVAARIRAKDAGRILRSVGNARRIYGRKTITERTPVDEAARRLWRSTRASS